ncbi:FAD-binding protein [Tissierella creatinini]|nr:FAD-binding protein [Tissierella creatinini]TJX66510.1 FAD-binding protein [Soehngenia saccharolytica]
MGGLNKDTLYDVLVIGGGPAGLNAALYSKRKGANVGIISKDLGGAILDTSSVENYLGYTSLGGAELAEKFKEHVSELDVPIDEFTSVEAIKLNDGIKELILGDGTSYRARAVIIATGSKPRKLGVPGETEFAGKGVCYCAICDGPFFTDEEVIVAGGGNSAVEAAIDLSKIASKVTIVHRSQFKADQILIDQLSRIENVEVHLNTEIREILGNKFVSGVKLFDKAENKEFTIEASGIFIEIGYTPNSAPFKDILELNEKSEIIVDSVGRTNVEGIYAAGDVTDTPYKQIIISASEGAKCALAANDYLNTL